MQITLLGFFYLLSNLWLLCGNLTKIPHIMCQVYNAKSHGVIATQWWWLLAVWCRFSVKHVMVYLYTYMVYTGPVATNIMVALCERMSVRRLWCYVCAVAIFRRLIIIFDVFLPFFLFSTNISYHIHTFCSQTSETVTKSVKFPSYIICMFNFPQ